MIGVGYEFATIVFPLPPHRRVAALLLLNLRSWLCSSIKL
jgi:hypothetical protein